jgi:thiamine biosynthesis lipoprotein
LSGAGGAVFTGDALGSPIRLVLGTTSRSAARAWADVLDELAAVDRSLSGHRDDSALARLNADAGLPRATPRRLRAALALAWRAYRVTGGLFDPRVTAVGGSRARLASTPWLRRVGDEIAVTAPVDLGGVGKGLALRWCARRLRTVGVTSFLLVAGGDLVACGRAPGGGPWRIGVAGLGRMSQVGVLSLPDRAVAVATSALTRDPDHILDPRTGQPPAGPLRQASVAAADPAWAEIWSKVALIEGIAPAARPGWWVEADGRLRTTAAGRAWVAWAR